MFLIVNCPYNSPPLIAYAIYLPTFLLQCLIITGSLFYFDNIPLLTKQSMISAGLSNDLNLAIKFFFSLNFSCLSSPLIILGSGSFSTQSYFLCSTVNTSFSQSLFVINRFKIISKYKMAQNIPSGIIFSLFWQNWKPSSSKIKALQISPTGTLYILLI